MNKLILATLVAVGLISSAGAQTQLTGSLTNGLVAYYPFNGNYSDSRGNTAFNNYGALIGDGPTKSAKNSLQFNYGQYGTVSGLGPFISNSVTISGWYYYTAGIIAPREYGSGFMSRVSLPDGSSPAFRINAQVTQGQSQIHFQLNLGEGALGTVNPFFLINTEKWYYITVIVETGNNQNWQFYVDGILRESGTNRLPKKLDFNYLYGLGCSLEPNYYWGTGSQGAIADWCIYNRALSSNEVANLYALENNPPLSLSSQPSDVQLAVSNSQNATFNIVATNGTPPYAYQWMKDGVDLTNQTNASLVLSNAGANTVGYYSCDVTDQTGTTVTSSNAALNISGVPFWLWQGLVAYYPFHGNANDMSGNGFNLSGNADFVNNRTDLTSEAFHFDSSQLISNKELPDMSSLSISVWFLLMKNDSGGSVITDEDGSGANDLILTIQRNYIGIRADKSGARLGTDGYGGIWPAMANVNYNASDSKWHNIVWVMTPSKSSIFLDNKLLRSFYDSASNIGHHGNLIIGSYFTSFNGSLDDIRIYNRALSSNEVAQLYTLESTLTLTPQTISFSPLSTVIYGVPLFNLTASASSGLPVSYSSISTNISISGNIVTVLGTGTATIVASQSGNSTYAAAPSITNTLVVNGSGSRLKNQAISFPPLKPRAWTNAPSALTAKASSMLPMTYTSSDATVATVSNGILTPVGVGTTTITAYQGGNTIYNPAKPVSQQQVITQATQKITFPINALHSYGDAPLTFSATSTSGLPITYTSLTPSVATVSGNVVTIVGAGTAKITASQNGNSLYSAATPFSQTLKVAKASQTVTFNPTTPLSYTLGGIISLNGSASSGLPITYTSSKASVITVGKGSSQGLMLSKGTTTITATQSGNANFNKASASATITLQ